MGRRKIDIKPIKDDRNRSVTFLKRKGGLFKKAHELSVLCNVEVAVIIFGTNKKVHEYSSGDIRDLITRYYHHAGPIEHRGPSDFKAGATDSDDEDAPDAGAGEQSDGQEPSILPQHFQGPPFAHMRQHTPSASPPIPSGAFLGHHGLPLQRAHTPQPHMGSRPSSRNDIRRMGPNMGQPVGPNGPAPQAVNGFAYMPQPAVYNPNAQNQQQANMPPHGMQAHGPQFPYPPPQAAHTHQMQAYLEDQRRSSLPPNFPPQQGPPQIQRHSVSPPPVQMPPQQQMHQMSPPPPHLHPMQSPPMPQHHQQQVRFQQHENHQLQQQAQQQQQQHQAQAQHQQQQAQQQHGRENQQQQQEQRQVPQVQVHEPLAPPPETKKEVKSEPTTSMRKPPLLDTGFNIKRLPQRKGGSIFTPIDENRSILAQHLSAFHPSSDPPKSDLDNQRMNGKVTSSPPQLQKLNTQFNNSKREEPAAAAPEGPTFTVPSRTSSMMTSATSRPRLKVQIPEGASETGGSTAAETSSPRNPSTDTLSQNSNSRPGGSIVLPPPSPSASSILSAGATGPVNPFARPIPQQHQSMHIDTPVSALPSRVMNGDFLPSPSSFFPDWNHSNTLPSPLNFATPLVANGPSFLRDEPSQHKRKSPEGDHSQGADPKRVKVDA